MMNFPKDFIFGAATAAYQAEGAVKEDGRGPCYWDEYLEKTKNFDPNPASDFYHQYKDDLALCKEFGINGIRISISWARILPNGTGEINPKGIEFYNNLINECLANGVEPFVTLHHFDTPLSLYHKGDWLCEEMIDAFEVFAKICFENFGDRVKKWVTINEPWSLAAGQYLIGHFPPNIHYDLGKAAQAMHNMVYAHARVVNLYKSMNLDGEIGIIHILEPKFPITDTPGNIKAAKYEHTFCNRFMLESTINGEYKPETLALVQDVLAQNDGEIVIRDEEIAVMKEAAQKIDFLGINYYASHWMEEYHGKSQIVHNGTGTKGTSIYAIAGTGKRVSNPNVPTTDWDWAIYPEGLHFMIMEIVNDFGFKKPIYITENGVGVKEVLDNGTVDDQARIDYIRGHMEAILKANEEGANVKGYFLWSLMDVFSWTNGYNKRYGLIYIDFETQKRYIKKSAHWYKELAESLTLK
ncbi:MAG: 6-phospho-beta-galactosidase [Bacillota bacterium]|nr:6-phospho-beta-galactosidase [Bacillota bacterium]